MLPVNGGGKVREKGPSENFVINRNNGGGGKVVEIDEAKGSAGRDVVPLIEALAPAFRCLGNSAKNAGKVKGSDAVGLL